ncbi:hypothetical protein O6H91_13G055800 [Diphasiastrum complanatum]|uniref:Uncharacterized protein n=1 Tax=Diphasiastrum complanatum TaxID=34168 RepID=A0ACC2BUX3_DIPCM|nr:hypothetical protein O6H91_13G055800 [Diphasiastrum complanatum]
MRYVMCQLCSVSQSFSATVLRGISSSFFYTNSTCRCGFLSKFNLVARFSKSSSLGRRLSYESHLSCFSHPSNSRFVHKPRPSLRGFSVTMAIALSLYSSQKMVSCVLVHLVALFGFGILQILV